MTLALVFALSARDCRPTPDSFSGDLWQGVGEDAKNALRVNAQKKYGADSVLVIGLDKTLTGVVAQGIAYKAIAGKEDTGLRAIAGKEDTGLRRIFVWLQGATAGA